MGSNMKGANAMKMKRMLTRKSHSWWWDSHISPKNSKWLEENLEKMDMCVKEMLKLIEEEGDSFAKKAEMYYKRRPELVAHVEDFYRMYRALAERYDHVTGELRKNLQSELSPQGSGGGSDFGSEPPSPSVPSFDRTPEPKKPARKSGPRAAGFEVFLGSGGGSDKSRKGSDDSSSSSDSDSDDTKDMNGDDESELDQRIMELENELYEVKEKLKEHEKCGELAKDHADLKTKISVLENELQVTNEKLQISEAEVASLQQKLKETTLSSEAINAELGYENMVLAQLGARVSELEAESRDNKDVIENLKGEVAARNLEIEDYKRKLADASEKFAQEKSHLEDDEVVIRELRSEIERISQVKSQLEACIQEQQHLIEELKATAESCENLLNEKSQLEIKILKLEGVIGALKEEIKQISHEKSQQQDLITELQAAAESSAAKFSTETLLLRSEISTLSQSNAALEEKLKQLEAENANACTERDELITELNLSLDALKQNTLMLLIEKDQIGTQMNALNDDIKRRDEHLHQLHMEHVKLTKELDNARRAAAELRGRVEELEVAIKDGAEGKREAIRQLCFSLEHYRDGYQHLCQVLRGHNKRLPAVVAV